MAAKPTPAPPAATASGVHAGLLQRLAPGFVNSLKTYYYVKDGVFLKEEPRKLGTVSGSSHTREIIDLTSADVEDSSSEICKPESFAVFARNGKEYHFLAPSLEDKARWLAVLRDRRADYDGGARTRRNSMPASLIAPVRRHQTRSESIQAVMIRRVAIIEADRRGMITQANLAAEKMFGWTEVEMVGKNVSMLMPEPHRSKHDAYVTNFGKSDHTSMLGKYRKLTGVRKNGEQFPVQIVLEQTAEGVFVTRMIELDTEGRESQQADEDYQTIKNLRLKILEGKNIGGTRKRDSSSKARDPYCVLLVDQIQRGVTSTKIGTNDPFWGEEFFFDDIATNTRVLTILVNNLNKSAKDPRIGQVQVNLMNPDELGTERWHSLMPLNVTTKASEDLGSLRFKTTVLEEKILPMREYTNLLNFMLGEQKFVAKLLSVVAGSALEEIAGTIVNIFSMKERALDFIYLLSTDEIKATEYANVIFRGNSLTTKVIDLYMKITGFKYLQSTLSPLIDEVYTNKLDCELDPARLEPGATQQENQVRLTFYCIRFWEAISSSVTSCPIEFSFIFENIRDEVAKKWPDGPERYTAVSGFIFLRFFCPAILNPVLFGLMEEHPSGNAARTLTLIAKILQNLANLVELGDKEPWLKPMNSFIADNVERVQKVITHFSKPRVRDVPKSDAELDTQALRRELAALCRHLIDKREVIMAQKERFAEEMDKYEYLHEMLLQIDRRYHAYERSKSFTLRASHYGNLNWEMDGGKQSSRPAHIEGRASFS